MQQLVFVQEDHFAQTEMGRHEHVFPAQQLGFLHDPAVLSDTSRFTSSPKKLLDFSCRMHISFYFSKKRF